MTNKKICLMCSKQLVYTHKFCSRKCYSKYQSEFLIGNKCNAYKNGEMQITHSCYICGSQTRNLKFCSKDCYSKYQSKFMIGEKSAFYKYIGNFCPNKGKTYEQIMGTDKALVLKLQQSKKRQGCKVWNNGLTKDNNDILKKMSFKVSENAKINSNYGMKNKHHSYITKMKMREKRAHRIYPFKDTSIELKIQTYLKILGIEFITHFYVKGIEHGYQCDIFIPSIKTIIECDGDYWHGNPSIFAPDQLNERQKRQKFDDDLRNKELISKGYKLIRLWEKDIKIMDVNKFNELLISHA